MCSYTSEEIATKMCETAHTLENFQVLKTSLVLKHWSVSKILDSQQAEWAIITNDFFFPAIGMTFKTEYLITIIIIRIMLIEITSKIIMLILMQSLYKGNLKCMRVGHLWIQRTSSDKFRMISIDYCPRDNEAMQLRNKENHMDYNPRRRSSIDSIEKQNKTDLHPVVDKPVKSPV